MNMFLILCTQMFKICVKVTVMLDTSVRVEPTAEPPPPPPPTPTTDSVTRADTASQGPACNRSVPQERSETPQVIISLPPIKLFYWHFDTFYVKNRSEGSNFKLKIKDIAVSMWHLSFVLKYR